MNVNRLFSILGLITIGIVSRLVPHPPNFNAINAIALLGAYYFNNRYISCTVVFSTLFLSDIFLGSHATIPFVYLSAGLSIMIGAMLKRYMSLQCLPVICVLNSLMFFGIVNFGVWMTGTLYSKTLNGLIACYLAAIPFLTNQIFGDLIFGLFLCSCYHFIIKFDEHGCESGF